MSRVFDPASADATLFGALLAARHAHGGGKIVLEDAERQTLTFDRLILGALVLGAKLAGQTRPGETVGLLLPNVNALPVTLLSLNAYGRTAALMNFTAGIRNLRSAATTAVVRTLVTSRRFVELGKLDDVVAALAETETVPGRRLQIVYLEDVRRSIGLIDKLTGVAKARFAGAIHRRHAQAPTKPAVVLFTSGTEGTPKAVVLSSRNLVANAGQIWAHAEGVLTADDVMMNPLPMFHSFGLTAGTLMPLFNGLKTVLYPSPLHYKEIPKLIAATKASVLVATDTFAQGYARSAGSEDLKGLRFIVCGAERVKPQTRALYSRFGTVLLEGYGATECAPVLACNVPRATRDGSVGPMLPGMETRLDPVSGIAEGGKLMIRGPNVMLGYMTADRPGVLVPPPDGWHDTGDIVTVDDGFITIRGRAKRFAKIGGEMVSLAAIEMLVQELWPAFNHVVVALPDPRKGEQLVLVTDKADADRAALLEAARTQGFPELWVPRAVLPVAALPVLGSGKLDLPATQDMAMSMRALL